MRSIAFITLYLFAYANASACDCVYNGPFIKMAKQVDAVLLIKVLKYVSFTTINGTQVPLGISAEIVEQFKGSKSKRTIVIWGDNGNMCRPYADTFKVTKHYVVAVNRCKKPEEQVQEKRSDFYISSCGCFFLDADIRAQTAKGDYNGNERLVALSRIKKLL